MWLNSSVATINATLQLLDIYRFVIYTPRTRTRPLEREIIGLPVISISHLSIISLKDFYIFKIIESKKNLNKN